MKMNLRSFLCILFGLLLALSLFTACNEQPNDGGGDGDAYSTETVEKLLRLDGVSAKMTQNGGVYVNYRVDASAVKELEQAGCTVVYGATVALAPDGALTVKGNIGEGYTSAQASSATAVAYATGTPAYVAATKYADGFSTAV